jgi:hypothetical protein
VGRKFFSLPKRVKPQNCLDPFVRRRKGDTTTWFWKKYVSLNKNQQNIRNCILERTKNCHKKKRTKPKTNGLSLDTFFIWQRL